MCLSSERQTVTTRRRHGDIVRGKKLTSDLSKAIRFEAGREKAREFLAKECRWTKEQFEEVDWDMLDATLEKKRTCTRCGSPNSTQDSVAPDYRCPITKDSTENKQDAPTVEEQRQQPTCAYARTRTELSCSWSQRMNWIFGWTKTTRRTMNWPFGSQNTY